jgi:hypothetical protein
MGGFLGEKCRPFCNFFGNPAIITVLLFVSALPKKGIFPQKADAKKQHSALRY